MGILKKYSNRMVWLSMSMFAAFLVGCSGSGSGSGTSAAAIAVAPTVIATTPDTNVTNVPSNRKIVVTFSTPMNAATITTGTFTLSSGGSPVAGSVAYYNDRTALFSPDANLTDSTVYTATVTTGAKSAAGTALAANYVWQFTTGITPDSTTPDVNLTDPLAGAVNVPINRTLTATFNEVMDPAYIDTTTFTLVTGIGGVPVVGTVSYLGTTASFNPTNDLSINTEYNATITTGVKDLAGNAMLVNKEWTFTTGIVIAAGPDPVNLGTAINYAILAKTAVSTVPNSVVTGNVGLSPAAATFLTGWGALPLDGTGAYSTSPQVVGQLHASDYLGGTTSADLTTAVLNMQAAYTDAAGRTATSAATTNVGSGTLTSLTLAPGVYEWGSAVTIPTDLTFSGTATDVWILKVSGTLDMAANRTVILNGALAKNIFWQVSGGVTIGSGTQFKGIVLGQTAITMGTLSSIEGRLLAQTAVSLDQTTVTQPAP